MTTSIPATKPDVATDRPVAELPPATGRARRRTITERNRPLWMLAPGGLLMVVVIVVPLLVALYISLLDLDQYTFRQWVQAPFIGLANYVEAVQVSPLLHSIGVSTSYAAIVTVATLPIGLAAALATQQGFRGRGLVRSVFLIPYVLPAFVVGTVWRIILQPDGVANGLLEKVGIHSGLWLNGPQSYWALIIVQTWASWPLIYLLALAGLQSVDPAVHEAAALDGAEWWVKLRYVIFPYLRGPVSLALLIAFLHNINSFTLPFVMFGVPSPHDVEVLPVLTYVESFQNFRFGLSAAMAVLSLLLIAIPLGIYLRAVKLDVGQEGKNP
ncbi:multiple sugar transport system permease protein [Allocatelliglobosispora scoriae]|uniref:Multiple sugar transport system permease protein n=1 Tax=Allocatelliglobosispora scoriae TaxID=643052 RepID=A0A841C1B0_9ACTN|nr:sugar ABC transporter permease [Allocatelliglobosispora scoriae]MBB5872661.1 multiple sugar transport system permease protein [Allocatelliglobosispora scoriae]